MSTFYECFDGPIWRAVHRIAVGLLLIGLLVTTGCMPTVSPHKYRDVAVTITETDSGNPIAQRPFQVLYTFSPVDSPLVLHLEMRTPKEVYAETDSDGKAVVQLADYSWQIYLSVDAASEAERRDVFILNKQLIRDGGTRQSHHHGTLTLELSPMSKPTWGMKK